ncbi:Peroxidase 27 [Asimina triloba]
MASRLLFKFLLNVGVVLSLIMTSANAQGLQYDFYKKTCPNVEAIVEKTTADSVSRAPSLAAPLLRMHFHDCFVRGCDGSVLLNSTATSQAEKDAIPNQSLRGFQVIDAVKAAVEKECPGVVSCADILALVASDAVFMAKGPRWKVPTGRRDGRISLATDVLANIPAPFFNITQLTAAFQQKGLSVKDLVVLSGGHTIGMGHCAAFSSRLYNFTGKGDADPSLDPNYAAKLRVKCPQGDSTDFVEMDPGSSKIFDTSYFTLVSKRRGLFVSDAALLNNNDIKTYIGLQINNQASTFFNDFGESMVKMGNISVLTGTAGEIRKICSVIN